IVSSGTIVKVSGRPYSQYDASDDFLLTAPLFPITDKNSTVFIVFESQSSLENQLTFQESYNSTRFVNINSDTRNTTFLCGNYRADANAYQLFFDSQQPTTTKRVFILKRQGDVTDIYDESNVLIDSITTSDYFPSAETIL